ncbi:MAG TPA: shikimate dehydrogenase [Ktedonobacteraceae bacterium]|nr:shikimate dehydrogenase [Ktedonobacteraceae bacterium]
MKQVGLIGYPVAHSRSPQMHNAAFHEIGFEAEYALWEIPPGALSGRVASLRAPNMLGANVTIPYKEDVVPLLDECDTLAARIGAVNTIVNRGGRLVGYNTDAPGMMRALAECPGAAFDGPGKEAVVLGTGGAARAAVVALMDAGARSVSILGRDMARVDALLRLYRQPAIFDDILYGALLDSPEAKAYLQTTDLVVNATSVGLKSSDDGVLIDVSLLPLGSLVMDMVFNAGITPLLQAARAHGCFVMNGLAMLLYQGTLAFELWTGRNAPVEVMRNALGLSR